MIAFRLQGKGGEVPPVRDVGAALYRERVFSLRHRNRYAEPSDPAYRPAADRSDDPLAPLAFDPASLAKGQPHDARPECRCHAAVSRPL